MNNCINPKCSKDIKEKGWCSDKCHDKNIGDVFPETGNDEKASEVKK